MPFSDAFFFLVFEELTFKHMIFNTILCNYGYFFLLCVDFVSDITLKNLKISLMVKRVLIKMLDLALRL